MQNISKNNTTKIQRVAPLKIEHNKDYTARNIKEQKHKIYRDSNKQHLMNLNIKMTNSQNSWFMEYDWKWKMQINYDTVIKRTRMCEYWTKYTVRIGFKFNQKTVYCNALKHYWT